MTRRNTVFFTALGIATAVIAAGFAAPEAIDRGTAAVHGFIIDQFGWGYLLSAFVFLAFSLWIAFSRFGRIKLGTDEEKPQYGYFAWFSMLFAAGMGIGLIFWGVAEPMSHFLNPPEQVVGQSGDAARFAMRYSFFHWGVHPWAIYIVMSLAIAYFSFRRGMPPLISSTFYPLIGDRVRGPIGATIDVLAIFATVFGVATSLGLGALQIAGGVSSVAPIPAGTGTTLIIIAVVTVMYMVSSATGLDKGVQILSRTNVLVALVLLAFMLVVGPTAYILDIFVTTLGEYLSGLVSMSLSTNPFEGYEWTKSWTLFYWAWWISWSPFVGLFVASISRGRTIREFVLGALLVPTILTFLWFAVFGGAGFHLELRDGVDFAATAASDVSGALFALFQHFPAPGVLSVLAIILLTVFFVTSADSATYVLAMMSSGGSLAPPLSRKVVWGIVQSTGAAVLLLSGGLEGLQRMAIIAALPFAVVMLIMAYSLIRAVRYEARIEWPLKRRRRAEDQPSEQAARPEHRL